MILTRRFLGALLFVSLAVSSWTAWKYRVLLQEARDLRLERAKAVTQARRARAQRQAFIAALGTMPLGRRPLTGYDHTSGRRFEVRGTPDGVYYLLDPLCAACSANLPALNSIAAKVPGSVYAIAPYDSTRLTSYVSSHEIHFPVLGRPAGALVDLIPRYATPLTVFVEGGRIVGIVDGTLDSTIAAAARPRAADRN